MHAGTPIGDDATFIRREIVNVFFQKIDNGAGAGAVFFWNVVRPIRGDNAFNPLQVGC